MRGHGRGVRVVLAALVGVLSGVLAFGVATPGAHASTPARAGTSTAPPAWRFIRYSCRTVAAGQVCLAFEGNGQPSTYRAVYVLKPKPGQWIRRAFWTETVAAPDNVGPADTIVSDGYRRFCSSACASDRSAATYVRPTASLGVQTFVFDTPQGSYDLSAGITGATVAVDDYCVPSLKVGNSLSSTSDGTVYLARQFYQQQTRPILARMVDQNRTVFTKSWPAGTRAVSYSSPLLYRSWTRQRTSTSNSGAWSVPLARAYQLYRDADGHVQKTYTIPGQLGLPC